MRKYFLWTVFMIALLAACGQSAPTWQEQYDLGLRYLSEGNYEEAIIAFAAAIEIDPKQPLAYVGRGDAYMGLEQTEENLSAAQADYECAIELDEALVEAYLGLAEVYIRQGQYEKALEILNSGLEKAGENQDIADQIAAVRNIVDNSWLFTAEMLKPEDLKLDGKPFWEVTIEEFEKMYPSTPSETADHGIHQSENERQYAQYLRNSDGYGYSTVNAHQRNGDSGIYLASCGVDTSSENVRVPDIRNIQWFDSCADVLSKLGLQEQWIDAYMAQGPGKDININFDSGIWKAKETTAWTGHGYSEEGDAAFRFIEFRWTDFVCEPINHTDGQDELVFQLDFNADDKLDGIVLWVLD